MPSLLFAKSCTAQSYNLPVAPPGDADPATLQIKRACNELEPTDTFPLKLYAEIVSNVILYRDTHIEIKLRNGQIL